MRPYLKAKNQLFILIAVFLCCCKLFSQEAQENLFYEKNFSAFSSYFLENYGIACKEPENMSILTYNVIWAPRNDSKRSTANAYGPIFQSEDKECILAYPITNIYFRPLNQIIAEIKSGLGTYNSRSGHSDDTSTFEFNNYVSTITGKAVRETFNIDILYIYDIPNADSSCFMGEEQLEIIRKENYPYCTGLVLCKEGRIATGIKLFLSEKGKLKEDEYIKMLSKLIRYSDTFEKKINWYMVQ